MIYFKKKYFYILTPIFFIGCTPLDSYDTSPRSNQVIVLPPSSGTIYSNDLELQQAEYERQQNKIEREQNQYERDINEIEREQNQYERDVNEIEREQNKYERDVNDVERELNEIELEELNKKNRK